MNVAFGNLFPSFPLLGGLIVFGFSPPQGICIPFFPVTGCTFQADFLLDWNPGVPWEAFRCREHYLVSRSVSSFWSKAVLKFRFFLSRIMVDPSLF